MTQTALAYATDQEAFWAGQFGDDYLRRNDGDALVAADIALFTRALARCQGIRSCVEFGANIGLNLRALRTLYPQLSARAIEINPNAAARLAEVVGSDNVHRGSIFDYPVGEPVDLALIKGVLIHIHPDRLAEVYDKLHAASRRYVLICEYYNPQPTTVPYRGHVERLYKRDFAGELLDRHADLQLLDYGFAYHRDPNWPQDDVSWFLLEKRA